MKKILLFFSLLCCLLAGGAMASEDRPFITRWDLSKDAGSGATQISFFVGTTGTVSYTWAEVAPGTATGMGTFTGSSATITGLPSGGTIDLSISPTNFRSFVMMNGEDRARLTQIKQWGTTAWTDMQNAFFGCSNMILTATDVPNTAAVNYMSSMFRGCTSFNQPLPDGFNTDAVIRMDYMFSGCTSYNQALPASFNTENVTIMQGMFSICTSYNQALPASLNTEKVTDMGSMFLGCTSYNKPLPANFNTAAVTSMRSMFSGALAFNRSLAGFQLNANVNLENFLNNSGLSVENYDATLSSFKAQAQANNITGRTMGAAGRKYCAAEADRAALVKPTAEGGLFGWTITDGGKLCAVTLTLGTATNPTTCGGTDGKIAFTYPFGAIPDGTYSMSYKLGGNTLTKDITFGSPAMRISAETISSRTAFLMGLGAGSYSDFSISIAGYQITIAGTQPVELRDPAGPTFTVGTPVKPTTCTATDGSLPLTGLANSTAYSVSYQKDGAAAVVQNITSVGTTLTIPNLGAGVYTNIKVTTSNNCESATATATIDAPTFTMTAGTPTNPTTCGGTGSIPFTTSLSLPTGTRSITYKKDGVDQSAVNVTVTNPSITITIWTNPPAGFPPLPMLVTSPAPYNAFTLSNLGAGNYTDFKIVHAGCDVTAAGPVELRDPAKPTFTVGTPVKPTTCTATDGSLPLTGLANSTAYSVSYQKDGAAAVVQNITSVGTTLTIPNLGAGVYTNIKVTAPNSCESATATATIAAPTFTLTAGTPTHPTTCGGNGSIPFTTTLPGGSYTITFKKGGIDQTGIPVTVGSPARVAAGATSSRSFTLSGITAGNYTDFKITYNGCEVTAAGPVELRDPAGPTLTIGTISAICVGATSFRIPYTGATGLPTTYSVSGTGITTATNETLVSNFITVSLSTAAVAGTIPYSLTVKNAGGCESSAYTGSVTVNAPPTAFDVTGGGPYCSGGVAIGLSGSETGVTYQLRESVTGSLSAPVSGTGSAISFGNLTAPQNTPFTYTVVATRTAGGCTATMTGSKSVKNIGTISVTLAGLSTICAGGEQTAQALVTNPSGLTGTWQSSNPAVATVSNTGRVEGVSAGTATFTFTEATAGCVSGATSAVTVNMCNSLTLGTSTNPTTCGGSDGKIAFTTTGFTGAQTLSYKKDGTATTAPVTITSNAFELTGLGAGVYSDFAIGVINATGSRTISTFPAPQASISGNATVCKDNTPSLVSFTATVGTAPYIFSYKINNGATQTISSNTATATLLHPTNVSGVFEYSLVGLQDGNGCSQTQSGSITVNVLTKPSITLAVNGQTLPESGKQTVCDLDANPVNSLQFTVGTACLVGNPVWRVQIGGGAWSAWSSTAPNSQASDNQTYRYQAACDANCTNTYTELIAVAINYRASVPQNVSLVADGTTVAAGQSKEICDQSGNTITFNATCAAGERLLYSVDGGSYLPTVPTQIVDGQFHNYRVRCQKSDGTPSCVETESGLMRLKISTIAAAPVASLSVNSGCGTPTSFSGTANCPAGFTTVWYNAATNAALPNLPTITPNETTSYYARCQNELGCQSANSNTVTFTLTPVNDAPVVIVSSELVCTGQEVTVSTTCPAGASVLWNTGVTESSFKVAFSNITTQSYSVRCVFTNGCQSAVSAAKTVRWKGFELTIINIGQSQSAIKTNDRAAWASQFVTPDGGPSLDNSTESNPTLYFTENVNKTGPRYWTINADACALGTDGSMTFDMLATPETGLVRSFNTHENNAPYFMYANRAGWTELYAQNHPAYGFFLDNGSGVNVYDEGLPKGLYKLGVRYWDMKGWGSIYPSTRKPQGNVLAYQEYWFRIQSKDGIGTGAARVAADNGQRITDNGAFAQVMPNPVSNVLRLKVTDAKAQKVNISLLDASGRTLLQRGFVPETNAHQEEFNVSEIANGMYFLKVNAGDKQTTLKVVKVQ